MTSASSGVSASKIPSNVYLMLLFGIISVSLSAIFIRLAQLEGVPSIVIAAGRLSIAAIILTPLMLSKHLPEIRTLTRKDFLLAVASGGILSLHFVAWISSLEYTSVLISTVFVTTGPLWVALLEVFFLRAKFGKWVWIGLGVALLGGMVIGLVGDNQASTAPEPVLGGLLALGGAISVAIYFVLGRKLRAKLPVIPYIWLVYSCTAIFLLFFLLISGQSVTGHSTQGYFWVVIMALLPQLIGHTSFNYALGYLSATYVSIITQIEPIGSAIAAMILFRETPLPMQIGGSIVILIGVTLASWGQSQKSEPVTPSELET